MPELETVASHECVVIGAGPAGLGTAAMLRDEGIDVLVVERAEAVAASWRARYDGFRLNTSRWFSYLPGKRFPRAAGRWPSRDALVSYYEGYAKQHRLECRFRTEVERIESLDRGWRLLTPVGAIEAGSVVVATGKYHTPVIPPWPGADGFSGEIIHSASYRNAEPFRGRHVLVVGPGASGFEIALQLAEGGAASARLSVRTPPHIVHRNIGPFPSDLFAVLSRGLPTAVVDRLGELIRRVSIGDLSRYGLDPPPDGIYTRVKRTGMIPTVDGPYVRAVKRRLVEVVPALESFERSRVLLTNGRSIEPDVVIAATGYRRNLEPLVGHLGLLRSDGHPKVHGSEAHPDAAELYFVGFTEPFSGNLRQLRLDAREVAQAVGGDALRLRPR